MSDERAGRRDLIEDLEVLLPSKPRPGDEPLEFAIIRPLVVEDIPHLLPVTPEPMSVLRVTARHHQLAQWIAQGKSQVEMSALGGVSVSYLTRLNHDPAFIELVAHYQKERELVFQAVNERMKMVGTQALDEIQARLDEDPGKWTNQQLMDLAQNLLVKGRNMDEGFGRGGSMDLAGIQINVGFVQASKRLEPASEAKVIEGEVVR